MLSEQAVRRARELRTLLGNGALTGRDHAGLGDGVALPLDLAVTIALNDLDDLTALDADGQAIDARRWQRLEADLELLGRSASTES